MKINAPIFYTTLAMVLFSQSGCSRDGVNASTPQAKIETNSDPNVISMEHPEQFPLVAIDTRKVAEELHVNGVVTPDVNRSVPVLSLSGGRAAEVRVRLGDDVTKGQVMMLISSPDVGSAFSEYQKFATTAELTHRQLERAQLLYSKGATAKKDLEVAEEADETAKVDLRTAADRLHILGADPKNPTPVLAIRAPISGSIIEQNVTGGTGVRSIDNSPNLFTIADMSHVWIVCDVYENMLSRVNVGDTAEVRLNAYPDKPFSGRVSNISRVLDPNTRAAKVRIEMDNPQRLMRAGMFATAFFRSRQQKERVVVPTSAVLRLQDRDWVFCPVGGNRFRRTEVQLGTTLPEGVQEVLLGLRPGDKVVSNALQFSSASETQ